MKELGVLLVYAVTTPIVLSLLPRVRMFRTLPVGSDVSLFLSLR